MERESFDAAYVDRLREGDPAVQDHFTRYFGDLLRIKLRSRLRSSELVDDVRQETFLRVFVTLRRNGLEHPERLGAFVNAVCNNVLLEHLRARGKAAQIPENAPEPVDERVNIEYDLVTEERKASVRSILSGLSPKDRDLLRSVFLEERDKDAVCREHKVDRQYLRVLLHRARKRLRASMERDASWRVGA